MFLGAVLVKSLVEKAQLLELDSKISLPDVAADRRTSHFAATHHVTVQVLESQTSIRALWLEIRASGEDDPRTIDPLY